jgi:hypothetical protein
MSRARNLGNLGNKNLITGDPNTTRIGIGSTNPVSTLNVAGIVSATAFYGDGSNLEGVTGGGGLGTALSDESTELLSQIFVTPRSDIVAAGTSVSVVSGVSGGGIAFTKLNRIDVGTGATFHVGAGTTLIMNVLSVF